MKASFTYYKINQESVELGDHSEHGWILPGMWEFALQDDSGHHGEVLEQAQAGEFDLTDLREVISFAESLGIRFYRGGFLSVDPDIDYQTGEETFYSLFIEGVTPSTYNRICRLLDR